MKAHYAYPIEYEIALRRRDDVERINQSGRESQGKGQGIAERISVFDDESHNRAPLLFLILYFGLYKFVGVFGAGTVVGYIEETIYDGYLIHS